MPSNPDEDELEEMKELATDQENKIGEKDEKAGKPKAGSTPSV